MPPLLVALLAVLAAYALGGVLGGRIVGHLRGTDLRQAGSGNVGATNALRTRGPGFALAVLAIDAGKGALAVLALPALAAAASPQLGGPSAALPYLCGAAATLGHCFPPWHGFAGGKGVATMAGALLALLPGVFGLSLAAFVLVLLFGGIVSLATLASTAVALTATWWTAGTLLHPAPLFALAMLVLVLFTHRQNWQRLRAGQESRFERARVLGRLLRLP